MKSISENSYGDRIGNAENLLTALQSFNGYQSSKPELSIEVFRASIADIKDQNNQVAVNRQNYALAVEIRVKIFENDPYSVKRILSPINATVKVSFGKDAKETTDVIGIIFKMRGANMRTVKSNAETFVSQSYQSYNSKSQFFYTV